MRGEELKVHSNRCPTETDMEIHAGPELLASGRRVAATEQESRDSVARIAEKWPDTGRVNKTKRASGTCCLACKLGLVQVRSYRQLGTVIRVDAE
jgi:hypothetical protein